MPTVYVGARVSRQIKWELAIEPAFTSAGLTAVDLERLLEYPHPERPVVLRVTNEMIEPLPHVVRRSPTGLEWGYTGSGPADLARSLLADHLNLTGDDSGELYDAAGEEVAIPDQEFKDAVVARFPRRGFAISSQDIAAWLAAHASAARRRSHDAR